MGRKTFIILLKWDDMDKQALPELTKEAFYDAINDLLKLYRRGELVELAASPLLKTPLFHDVRLANETVSLATARDLTEAALSWGINKLKPSGKQDWHDSFWRHYNVLSGFYLDGLSINELAERMDIAEQTFYEWRNTSLEVLGQLLYQECYYPSDLFARQQQFIKLQYHHLTSAEQATLTLVMVSDSGLPLRPLFTANEIDILHNLHKRHFVTLGPDAKTVSQSALLCQHLQQIVPEENRRAAHAALADKFNQAGLIQEALLHRYQSGQLLTFVQTAVAEQESLFKQGDIQALHALLEKAISSDTLQMQQIDPNLWAQFLLVAARSAAWVEALDLALAYSRQALSAPDITLKIRAYYQRAKLLSRVNLDECLSHYAVCLDLIERSGKLDGEAEPERDQLATQMFIDRAWIFIQERPDYVRADEDLTRAEAIIPIENSSLWCDIYNARAGLISRSRSAAAAIPFRLKALTAAEESGDIERMTKMAYNVGSGYLFAGEYKNGRAYLNKSLDWAQKSGNVQTLGLAHKGLGNCDFFTGAYEAAITHYEKAYKLWDETNNKNWQTHLSYDLVEAYATVGRFFEARKQFQASKHLASALGHERVLAELEELAGRFPALKFTLNSRQAEALAYIDTHGRITRQNYIDLTGIAKSQAHRDLTELCEFGLLARIGKGRGTQYVRQMKE